jgi:hypothetical protein
MYDSVSNVNNLNQNVPTITPATTAPQIINDPTTASATAIVTRKVTTDASQIPVAQPKASASPSVASLISTAAPLTIKAPLKLNIPKPNIGS